MFRLYEVYTDLSEIGTGGILFQDQKLVRIFSHKLTTTELEYNIIAKEMLPIIKSLKNFKCFIGSKPIKIYTDNQNLSFPPVKPSSRDKN